MRERYVSLRYYLSRLRCYPDRPRRVALPSAWDVMSTAQATAGDANQQMLQSDPESEQVPTGLQWLQSTVGELRGTIEEIRKQNTRLGMRVSSLEGDAKYRQKENEELKTALAEAESQLDESSASMRAAVRDDVLSDIETLMTRDRALATALVLVTAKIMQSGAESLARLGLPEDVVATVRGMVFGGAPASVPVTPFMDSGNGMRYSAPPSTAEPAPQARNANSMTYTRMSGEEYLQAQLRDELEARENPRRFLPRRASDQA